MARNKTGESVRVMEGHRGGKKRRGADQPAAAFERLEDRLMLSGTHYTAEFAFADVTSDLDGSGTLTAGDIVMWDSGAGETATGLVYGEDAFSSIQAAINYTGGDGDAESVKIASGTYGEALNVGKDISLIGSGVGRTVLDGTGLFGFGLTSSANLVTASGLSITNWAFGAANVAGGELALSDSALQGNSSAAYVGSGTLTMTGSTINTPGVGVFVASTGTASIYNTDLSGAATAIQNQSLTAAVDASGNWWGTTDEATIAASVAGAVDFTPFLESGSDVDADAANGFDGNFSALRLTTLGSQTGSTGRIQETIDRVDAGGTVHVNAGTYAEQVVVDKSVSLLGPNAGIDANTGTRVAEAIITADVSGPSIYDSEDVTGIYISADDVTIDGLTIDGDNTDLTSGVVLNGADLDMDEGITSYDGVGHISILNNIVRNTGYTGINFYNYNNSGGVTTNNVIAGNLVDNLGTDGWGVGLLLYNNFYAHVHDNVIDNVRAGLQTGNYYRANTGDATYQVIEDNQISATRRGVFHNLAYSDASTFTYDGNVISAIDNVDETEFSGVLLSSIQGDVDAIFTNNTINGAGVSQLAAGFEVWNTPTTADLALTGGTISGVDYGLFVNNYEGYNSDGNAAHLILDGVSIDASDAGIYVLDSPSNTNDSAVSATVAGGTTINGAQTGLRIEGANTSVLGMDVAGTLAMTNVSGQYIMLADGAYAGSELDATGVSFDGLTGATATLAENYGIEDKITHATDDATLGTVRVKSGEIFVTTDSGSVQRGIDAATAGDTVHVDAGTFAENLYIDKSIELAGSGQGVTNIVPESTGLGIGESGSMPAGSSQVMLVGADDVTIHDLTVDGDNPNLTSGTVIDGADIDARNGIIGDYTAGVFNNLEVYNTTVQNIYLRGLYASTGGTFNLHHNTVRNVQGDTASIAIMNWAGSGTIAYNVVEDAFDGIVSNHSSGTTYRYNQVTHSGTGIHTDNATGADLIEYNTVTDGAAGAYGIFVFAPRVDGITVQHNDVSGVDVGYAASREGVDVSTNFIDNTADLAGRTDTIGLLVTTDGWGWGSENIAATWQGGLIENADTGIRIEADAGYTAELTLGAATTLNNVATGVEISGAGASLYGADVLGNLAMTNVSGQYIMLADGAYAGSELDATGVSFDGLTGATATLAENYSIEDKITHATDDATLGTVRVKSGEIFVTTDSGSVQRGIDAATAGDDVHVQAGTYVETLTVDKGVAVLGDDGAALDGTGLGLVTGVSVHSGDVTLDNMTVQNFGGNGIIVGYEPGGPGDLQNVVLTNNTVTNIQPGSSRGFGIYVGYEAEGFGAGTLTEHLDYTGLVISGNEVSNTANAAMVLQSITSSGTPLLVSGNTLQDAGASGLWIDTARNIGVQDNTFAGNGNGMYFSAIADGWYVSDGEYGPKDISVTGNVFDGNTGNGLVVYSGWADTIAVHENVFTGNGTQAANYVGATLDASANYWGSTDEATVAAGVSGDVDVSPYLATGDADASTPGVQADYGTLYVTDEGSQSGSAGRIGEAIDLANVGGTVNVNDGTYSEGVVIDKALSLIGDAGDATAGPGADAPVIDPAGSTHGVHITSSDVTVEGFVVTNARSNGVIVGSGDAATDEYQNVKIRENLVNPVSGGHGFGIYAGDQSEALPGGTGDARLTGLLDFGGLEITGNEIVNANGAALVLQSLTTSGADLLLQGNYIHGGAQSGVWIDSAEHIDVKDNTLSGNANGVFISAYADAYYEGTSGDAFDSRYIDIAGNTISNNTSNGVAFYDGYVADIHINQNTITGNGSAGVYNYIGGAGLLDATYNNWGTVDGSVIATMVSGDIDYTPYLDVDTDLAMVDDDWAGLADGTQVVVGDVVYEIGLNAFDTVAEGVAAVDTAGQVNVLSGTYTTTGQIEIAKDLSLVGEDRATTIIGLSFDTGTSGDSRGWFLVGDGVSFDLSGVTLDGSGGKVYQAIRTTGSGSIDDVAFANIAHNGYTGVAIAAFGAASDVDVTNSTFENIGRIGVLYYGGGTTGTFAGNTYTGKGAGDWLDYALDISAGATIDVYDNTITNNYGVASSDGSTSAGILVSTYFAPGTTATIHNNFITGNSTGVFVGYDASDTSDVTISENDLSGNDQAVQATGVLVDASGNWFGSTDEATVAAMISGDVDITPYLASGDADASTAGFQGDYSTLYVTDEGRQSGSGRIQEAVDLTSAGGTIHVNAGLYTESITVDKSLDLLGPNAGIDPNTGVRGPEAILQPDASDPDPYSSGAVTMLYIDADDVTVDGLVFDGDNPNLTSGVVYNGADIDACEAIGGYGGVGGISIINNVIRNIAYTGIDLYNYVDSSATIDNTISNNYITNLYGNFSGYEWGVGILVYNNFYATISNNVIEDVRAGIQTGNYWREMPAGGTAEITDNTIVARRRGIFHNLAYSNASPWTLSGNVISGMASASDTVWDGILLSSLSVDALAQDNVIDGSAVTDRTTAGYQIWNVSDDGLVQIDGGSVTGVDYGVWANNYEGYSSNAGDGAHVLVSGLDITADEFGIYVLDSPDSTSHAAVNVEVQAETTIAGATTGVRVDGASASAMVDGVTIENLRDGVHVTDGAITIANSDISNNTHHGLIHFGDGDVTITDTTFSGNASGQPTGGGYGDVTLYDFTGDATLTNVDITVDNADYGLQIRGTQVGGGDETPTAAAGNISLDGVTISGDAVRYGMVLQTYLDAGTLSFNNVSIDANATYGLAMWDVLGSTIDLGNTTFANTHTYDLVASLADIDATGAIFLDSTGTALNVSVLASNFAIEDRVGHGIDYTDPIYGAGLVTWNAGNLYVTPNSWAPTLNTAADIQRAIDLAADGETIHVAAGTYDNTLNIEGRDGLSIVGEDRDAVILAPSSALDWNVGSYGSARKAVIRLVDASNISLSSFTTDMEAAKGAFVFAGMGWDSEVSIDDTVWKNNAIVDTEPGGYYELGWYLLGESFSDAARGQVSITNSDFIDMGRVAIVTHDYLDSTISGNTFVKTTDDFGYGVEIGSESTGEITNNVFSGFDTYAASDGSGSGAIYIENAFTNGVTTPITKSVLVDGNDISDSTSGIIVGNSWASLGGPVAIDATITNNTIDNTEYGVQVTDSAAAAGSSVTVTMAGNEITNSSVAGVAASAGDGDITISIDGDTITGNAAGLSVDTSDIDLSVQNTDLTGNVVGAAVSGGAMVDLGGGALGSIGNNDLSGYTGGAGNYAVENLNEATAGDPDVAADNNNWGTVATLSAIEGVVFDDTDDATNTQVIYTNPQNLTASLADTVWVDDDWAGAYALGQTFDHDADAGTADLTWGVDAFAIIQDGVNAVADAGTINVLSGTYTTAGQVEIAKDLSLVGEDRATTVIGLSFDTGTSGDSRGWFLVGDGVSFDLSGVTLDGSGGKVYQAIRTTGSGSIDDVAFANIAHNGYTGVAIAAFGSASDVDITNSTFENIGRIGVLYYGGGTTGTFAGNTYTGKGAGDWLDYALDISAGATIDVYDNTITNNYGVASSDGSTSAGILISTYFGPGTTATIHNNFITGNSTGVFVGYDASDASDVTISENDLSGNGMAVQATGALVDASGNWFGSTDEATVAAMVDGDVDITPYLASGDADASTAGFQADYSTLYVTDEGSQSGSAGRIGEAIDLVTVGGTVNVNAGTYVESITIDKSLELLGAGAASTTLDASGLGGGIQITASDVTVDGLEIVGDAATKYGLYINGGDAGLSNIAITNNDIHGMAAPNSTATPGSPDVYMSYGILADSKGASQWASLSNLTISGNSIHDIGDGVTSGGYGLNLYDVDGATISGNAFADLATSADLDGTAVSVSFAGSGASSDPYNGLAGVSQNVAISGNTYGNVANGISLISNATSSISENVANFAGVTRMIANGGDAADRAAVTLAGQYAVTDDLVLPALQQSWLTAAGADATDGYYDTIQAGINNSAVAATVDVSAGTFNESLAVNVEGLSLVGAGEGTTVVDHSGTSGVNNAGVYVSVDGVTVDGLTVTGNPVSSTPRYGFKIGAVDGATVQNVTVSDSYRSGLDVLGASNITIDNVTLSDNGGHGLALTDVNGAALSNLDISGSAWNDISIVTWGRYSPLGTSGIVFSGTNRFAGNAGDNGGMQLEMGNYNDPANPEVITWSTDLSDAADVTVQPGDFGYVLGGPSDDVYNRLRFFDTLDHARTAAEGSPSHILGHDRYIQDADSYADQTHFYVYDLAGDTMSIQAAVDAATAGDVVDVFNGMYLTSGTTLDKAITIDGESRSGVVIAPSVAGSNAFDITSNDVTIRDLTIDGEANNTALGEAADANSFYYGVFSSAGDNITLDSIDVLHTTRRGVGLFTLGSSGHLVQNTYVQDVTQSDGIFNYGEGTYANNVVENVAQAGNGSGIRSYGAGVFTNNQISDAPFGLTADTHATMTGNTIDNVEVGIVMNNLFYGTVASDTVIQGNTITNLHAGSSVMTGVGMSLVNLSAGSLVGGSGAGEGNTISMAGDGLIGMNVWWNPDGDVDIVGNELNIDGDSIGMLMQYHATDTAPTNLIDNTITQTSGSQVGVGVKVTDNGEDKGDGYVAMSGNAISGFAAGVEVERVNGHEIEVTLDGDTLSDNATGVLANGGFVRVRDADISGSGTGLDIQAGAVTLDGTTSIAPLGGGTGVSVTGELTLEDDASIVGGTIGVDILSGGVATISGQASIDQATTGVAVTDGGQLFMTGDMNDPQITGATTGVLVSAGGEASIQGGHITGNTNGVNVDGGTALIETTNLNGNTTYGLKVEGGGYVDAGQVGTAVDFTGLGISSGGNDFSAYQPGVDTAISNANSGSPYNNSGPQGMGYDVMAQGNTFYSSTPSDIEGVVLHDVDSFLAGFVDYAALSDLSLTVDPASTSEGSGVTLSGSFVNVAQVHTVTIDWGDGSQETFTLATGANSFAGKAHAYTDDNPTGTPADTYTITVTVTERDGEESTTATADVTVNNAAPVVDAGSDATLFAGGTFTQSGSFTDDGTGANETWTAEVNYDDGNGWQSLALSGQSFTLSTTYATAGTYNVQVKVTDDDGGEAIDTVAVTVNSSVDDINIFYNNSWFDGNDTAANASDDAAIATDKAALLPGQTATFANYISYSRGINGIMVDVNGLPATLSASDFEFKVGNDSTPSAWAPAASPASVDVRSGAGTGGSDRVTITWADNAIPNSTWLQVTVKANANTGLAQDVVFYYGLAIGETGDSTSNAFVNAMDANGTRNNPHNFLNRATVEDAYDFNRDSFVNALDINVVRGSSTNFLNDLNLISVPATLSASPVLQTTETTATASALPGITTSQDSDALSSTSSSADLTPGLKGRQTAAVKTGETDWADFSDTQVSANVSGSNAAAKTSDDSSGEELDDLGLDVINVM